MQYAVQLKAGQLSSIDLQGLYFALLDLGAAGALEIGIFGRDRNEEIERLTTAPRGTTVDVPGGFTRLEFRAANDCTIQIVVSMGRVRLGAMDGVNVNATITSPVPLPVVNDRGSPGNPVNVVGITYSDAPATSATNGAPVACGPVAAVVAAADAAAKSLRLCNLGPDPVAIGPAGITWASRTIVLEAGDVWIEDRGANLAWSAITDAGAAASVTAQRVKA